MRNLSACSSYVIWNSTLFLIIICGMQILRLQLKIWNQTPESEIWLRCLQLYEMPTESSQKRDTFPLSNSKWTWSFSIWPLPLGGNHGRWFLAQFHPHLLCTSISILWPHQHAPLLGGVRTVKIQFQKKLALVIFVSKWLSIRKPILVYIFPIESCFLLKML